MMTAEELSTKLKKIGKKSDEDISAIVEKYTKTIEARNAYKFEKKSARKRIRDLMKELGYEQKNCRFFNWCPGFGIFVYRRSDTKAEVSFSFLNPNDTKVDGFKYDERMTNFYALLNNSKKNYTYVVDWKGRSEFAVYDAFIQNHRNFPGIWKELSIVVGITFPGCDEEVAEQ